MKCFVRLESKYGIKITEEVIYNPLSGKFFKRYRMYSADGCPWAKGLTKEGVKAECEKYSAAFLRIKNITDVTKSLQKKAERFRMSV